MRDTQRSVLKQLDYLSNFCVRTAACR